MKDVLTDKYNLLFGNCLERMKEIPDGSVDLILTDLFTMCNTIKTEIWLG